MNRTAADINAQIHRLEVNANDARFDAGMRAMFRKSARSLKRNDCQIHRSKTMIVTTGPDLASVLRIVDSCGGPKMPGESDEHHAGYNAALKAVERELTRAWEKLR